MRDDPSVPRTPPDDTANGIPAGESLFRGLLDRHPALEMRRFSKGVLVVASHVIEELASLATTPTVLLTGFQHTNHWIAERDRYLEMAGSTEVFAVHAGGRPLPEWGTDELGHLLHPGNPLEREWFVVASGLSLAITLCGIEEPARGGGAAGADEDRPFEVIWSVDPAVARDAASIVLDCVARDVPARAADLGLRVRSATPAPDTVDVVSTADRTTAGLLHRLEDLRDRERAAERRVSEAKTEFLSRISHELRTPLNSVLGFAQLLEGADLTEEDADSLRRISQAGHHLLSLVDDLIDVSRIESGMLPVDPVRVDVAAVVAEAVTFGGPAADPGRIVAEGGAAGPFALADRRYVLQILVNLLANAVKYDHSGRPVRIGAAERDGEVRVDVHDHGPGIEPADLDEIFAPFARLETDARDAGGTGLGLSIARAMAAATGGRIEVRSVPREGSTFTLVLPAARPGDGR